jgi:hypothetical protein
MRIELTVAIVAGVAAMASAIIAYIAQAKVAQSQVQIAQNQVQIAALERSHQEQIVRLQSALQQAQERQKPFLERQMQHYFEVADVASKIATLAEKPARQIAVTRFWQLYWGALAVVEDPVVERAMVNFGNALQQQNPRESALQRLSLELAHACRNSLERLWGTDLGSLQNLRQTQN